MGLEEPVLAIIFTSALVFVFVTLATYYATALVSAGNQPLVGVMVNGNTTSFNITLTYMHGPPATVTRLVLTTNDGIVTCNHTRVWVCDGGVTVSGDVELLPGARTVLHVYAAPGLYTPGRTYGIVIIGDGFTEPAYFRPG